MHGQKELEENTRQYCIQKEQNDKYNAYLSCFTGKDDYQSCLTAANVNVSKLNACYASTDKQYQIMAKFADKTTWLNGSYPVYPIYNDLNTKYGVQGSPTLVINGAQAQVDRTPEAVKEAVCASFNNAPAECKTALSSAATSPGFGTDAAPSAAAGAGGCGGS
jgi:hypothetical protein